MHKSLFLQEVSKHASVMQGVLLVSRGGNGNRDLSLTAIYKGVLWPGMGSFGPIEV